MRYCIACQHLHYEPREDTWGYGSTLTGKMGGYEARMACKKKHWFLLFDSDSTQETFEKAMETAETCPDFTERRI